MPTLINKIQDRQNIARWKREYSLINNAFQKVFNEGIDVCEYSYWGNCAGTSLSKEFREKMIEQLKIVDYCTPYTDIVCDNGSKSPKRYPWADVGSLKSKYKALGSNTYSINNYNWGSVAYLLNDGAAVYFGGGHGGPWIVIDVNNANHGPNEFGRDVFVIKVVSDKITNQHWIKPVGADGTYNKVGNGEICECSKDKGLKTASWLANPAAGGNGEYISGACCSAYHLYTK